MALVDYSGSEESDEEEQPIAKQLPKPNAKSNRPAFQKVVDRSEPHKIRVTLPESQKPKSGETSDPERPAKRAKVSTGAFSDFNSLLPAPKRAPKADGAISLGGNKRGGLGSGVSLKTGATPGFSREIEGNTDSGEGNPADQANAKASSGAQEFGGKDDAVGIEVVGQKDSVEQGLKSKGKTTMFKPLSVARKSNKKKPTSSALSNEVKVGNATRSQQSKPVPKASLFSSGDTSETPSDNSESNGSYQPMVYKNPSANLPPPNPYMDTNTETGDLPIISTDITELEQPPQTLDAIASDLNLSASAKRQLLGRQKNNSSAVNIVNFNIDEEYKSNEALRQSGEQIQHNPVRAIAPGKHSLKQLVNMGTSQADALEESFASGRRNRSEAGSKYGW